MNPSWFPSIILGVTNLKKIESTLSKVACIVISQIVALQFSRSRLLNTFHIYLYVQPYPSWGPSISQRVTVVPFRKYNSHLCLHSNPNNCCTVVLEKNIFKHVLCIESTQAFLYCIGISGVVVEKHFLKIFPTYFFVKIWTSPGVLVSVRGSRC